MNMKDPVREKLEEKLAKGDEAVIDFIWTCGSVPMEERGRVVSIEGNYVILKDEDGNINEINLDNVFRVK